MDLPPALCTDCGVDTAPCTGRRGCRHAGRWEWYMVRDQVWRRACAQPDDFLCIACLEKRLGRPLITDDFTDYPINDPHPWDTARLAGAKRP